MTDGQQYRIRVSTDMDGGHEDLYFTDTEGFLRSPLASRWSGLGGYLCVDAPFTAYGTDETIQYVMWEKDDGSKWFVIGVTSPGWLDLPEVRMEK